MRSLLAVLSGLVVALALVLVSINVTALLLGIPAEGPLTADYYLFNLTGIAIAGAAGGAVAMRLAPHAPHGHVIALAVVILLLSLTTILAAPVTAPSWYRLVSSLLGPVAVFVGGLLGLGWRRAAERRRTLSTVP